MRILIVIETLGRGGAEHALLYLLPQLRLRGFDFEVAALWPPYQLAPELEAAGIPVRRLNVKPHWNLPVACAKIVEECRRGRFQIVHSHLFFARIFTALALLFSRHPRLVVSFHSLDYESYPAFDFPREVLKAADGLLMRRCIDGYVAVSSRVAQHYQAHLRLREITVIPNALPVTSSNLSNADRDGVLKRYGIPPGHFLILTVGRFVKEKGQRFLLDAIESLRRRNLRPFLLMLGDGPLIKEISGEVRSRKLDVQVRIHPAVPQRELLKVMQAADALVFASLQEGFPLAPAEAMLMQKPVLATAVGGLPELIEDGVSGLLVPPADPEAMATKISRLMAEPNLRKRLGKAGRQRVLQLFSFDAIVPKWEQFYWNLAQGGNPA